MAEMLDGLRKGGSFVFGGFTISDEGLTVRPKGIFKAGRAEFFEWAKLKWGIVNGNLVLHEGGFAGTTYSERFVPVGRQRAHIERRAGASPGTR